MTAGLAIQAVEPEGHTIGQVAEMPLSPIIGPPADSGRHPGAGLPADNHKRMHTDSLPTIPGYLVSHALAHGGMATVYAGHSEKTRELVAIKVMAAALGADPSFRRRFLEECQLTKELKHAHIVRIPGFGCVDLTYYMVMEHLPGGTLADRINTGIPETDAVRILKQLAAALGYAHSHGIVHRDIKASNVLFRSAGEAVLSDFGIAKAALAANKMTKMGMVIGTPEYMSPEQGAGKELDGRSDLYSVGVMFFEMLTGALPYIADDPLSLALMHRDDAIPVLPEGFKKFQPIMSNLLAKNREERFPDAATLLQALEQPDKPFASRPTTIREMPKTVIAGTKIVDPVTARESVAGTVSATAPAASRRWIIPAIGIGAVSVIAAVVVGWRLFLPQTEQPPAVVGPSTPPAPALTPRSVSIGSTSEEIASALQLCQQYRKDCKRDWYDDEKVQKVWLSPFEMDKTEVTNQDFAKFVAATNYKSSAEKLGWSMRFDFDLLASAKASMHSWKAPTGPNSSYKNFPDHPVTNVSWNDADAYCRWRGARLPTANEWEYTARGEARRIFPWGSEWKPELANWQSGQSRGTRAVGSIPNGGTPRGVVDLAGNVWEWTGTKEGDQAILKGGSWMETNPANLRPAARRLEDPSIPGVDDGFRCARDLNEWSTEEKL